MSLLPFQHDFFSWSPERDLVVFKDRDASTKPFSPILNVDLIEMEDKFEVHADLPGVSEDDLDVSVENHHLVIKGHRERNYDVQNSTSHRVERSYGSVSRSIRLPPNADQTSINASFENGVLTVSLPKVAPTPSSNKIPVNVKK
jgi:HSP20 family protein